MKKTKFKISRRGFLQFFSTSTIYLISGGISMSANAKVHSPHANQEKAPFNLPNLPYDKSALEPHMSSQTFDFHHGKHHQTYVTNLNKLVESSEFASQTLEEIIINSHGKNQGVFNNSAQIWNHTFFWHSMTPNGGGEPTGKLKDMIVRDFGSFEKFAEEFKNAGATQFGSGWAWLVLDGDKLKVTKTANAELPMTSGQKALLCCDVWEHAYYLDHQNKRPAYLETFLNHLANWKFAEENLNMSI